MDTYRTLKMKGLKAGVYFQSISKCVCTTRTNHVILFTMKDTENEQTSKEKTVEQTVEIDIAERSADGKCLPKHQSTFIVNSFYLFKQPYSRTPISANIEQTLQDQLSTDSVAFHPLTDDFKVFRLELLLFKELKNVSTNFCACWVFHESFWVGSLDETIC